MATETKKKTERTTEAKSAKSVTSKEKDNKVDTSRFAVVDVNGEQIQAFVGYTYELEKLDGEKGGILETDKVLLVSDGKTIKVGKPYVEGAKVVMEIESQKKDKKQKVFKYKAKARYRRTYGHRQLITRVRVTEIVG